MTTARRTGLCLVATGALLLTWAAWLACSGGVTFAPFGIRISADLATDPLRIAADGSLWADPFRLSTRHTTATNRLAAQAGL